ncbi:hypothetical protein QBC43DRAFT_348648 [Cladorrhinum sp. PSN259]|nr:hypothetical protein QBC43DRAFT_348648 [Cladorrhinum sp. PSN259]
MAAPPPVPAVPAGPVAPAIVPAAPVATTPDNVISSRRPNAPRKVINDILKLKSSPTYYHAQKAWAILGFHNKMKPSTRNMLNQLAALWQAIASIKTRRSRTARAHILDALRTLGYRSPLWKASSRALDIGHVPAIVPWPPPQVGGWGTNNASQFLSHRAPPTLRYEHWAKRKVERQLWQDYHRYQGFTIASPTPEAPDNKIHLRAIPMPNDSDSLWRSVAYWVLRRQTDLASVDHGPDVSRYWVIKMQIWAYFMQALKDGSHLRWCEYHTLQKESKTSHPEFGILSMARSLYASGRQGLPAYPHECMLFVIADFFGRQVVVFRVPDPQLSNEDTETLKLHQRQNHTDYEVRVYGEPSVNNKRQILLVTDQKSRYYDPADFDYGPLHEKSGWSEARQGAATPGLPGAVAPASIQVKAGAGDFCAPRGPCTWWPGEAQRATAGGGFENWNARNLKANWDSLFPNEPNVHCHCPNDLARFNYFPPEDRADLDANIDAGNHNEIGPHHINDGVDRSLYGPLPHRWVNIAGNNIYQDVVITNDIFKCFKAGIDIPGMGFSQPYADDTMNNWKTDRGANNVNPPGPPPANMPAFTPVQSIPEFEWRFGQRTTQIEPADGFQLLDNPYLEFEDNMDMVEDELVHV